MDFGSSHTGLCEGTYISSNVSGLTQQMPSDKCPTSLEIFMDTNWIPVSALLSFFVLFFLLTFVISSVSNCRQRRISNHIAERQQGEQVIDIFVFVPISFNLGSGSSEDSSAPDTIVSWHSGLCCIRSTKREADLGRSALKPTIKTPS